MQIGNKIIPKIGDYKGVTLTIISKGKVVQGNKKLGTKKGLMVYLAAPENSVCPAYYHRKDFEAVN